MTHTPGPWELQLANSGARIVAGKTVICSGLAGNRANARLIAAAPDMLDALKSADEWRIRIAIAKATGAP